MSNSIPRPKIEPMGVGPVEGTPHVPRPKIEPMESMPSAWGFSSPEEARDYIVATVALLLVVVTIVLVAMYKMSLG